MLRAYGRIFGDICHGAVYQPVTNGIQHGLMV